MTAPRLLAPVLLAAALAACGSSGKSDESAATPSPTASATPSPTGTAPAAATALTTKPTVHVPRGRPPKRLVIRDIRKGAGPVARTGANVTVQYVGVSYTTGRQFDASWDRNQPFSFKLGAGQVIPGWDQGVVGMRVGGRRMLVIPPKLAYGPQGQPPTIAPNETLVFVIDLVSVH